MTPWLESVGVVGLAGLGVLAGERLSRRPRGIWAGGYVLAFSPILLIALLKRVPALGLVGPLSWLVAGRSEFVVTAPLAAMVLSLLAPRLARRRDRAAVRAAIVGFTLFCALPFALPPLMAASLASLQTNVDADGVCRQSRGYNCGPAAAVTALRRLGLDASEGELAVLAGTTPVSGTQADTLCEVLGRRYAREGLRCRYRSFDSLADLRDAGVVITVINFSLLVDHYVTVLEVGDVEIRLGDPLEGSKVMRREEFERVWRRVGIVVRRGG